ncbi:hypothetical protein TNCV_2004451 [Trichonephila clavipes]|nr:hypothetical protein TNCV_2004451 [Trichonephila clavipes]
MNNSSPLAINASFWRQTIPIIQSISVSGRSLPSRRVAVMLHVAVLRPTTRSTLFPKIYVVAHIIILDKYSEKGLCQNHVVPKT